MLLPFACRRHVSLFLFLLRVLFVVIQCGCQVSGKKVDLHRRKTPIVAVCNYVFDSLRQDAFRIQDGTLYENRRVGTRDTQPTKPLDNLWRQAVYVASSVAGRVGGAKRCEHLIRQCQITLRGMIVPRTCSVDPPVRELGRRSVASATENQPQTTGQKRLLNNCVSPIR